MTDEKTSSEDTSTEENETEEEVSDEETEDTSGEDAKEKGEKTQSVPYSRFKEVNDAKKKLEQEIENLKGKKEKTADQPKAEATDKEWKERMEFITNHELGNAKKEKMDFIQAYAKGKGLSLEDAYNEDLVQETFSSIDQKVAKEKAVPEPSQTGGTYNKKPLHEVSKEELSENFDEVARKAIQAGKSKERKKLGL